MAEMFNPQNPEILELNRQRKMAELLTNQGFQTPQGQTVAGGVYVPVNPLEHIASLYSVYAGKKKGEELDIKEQALAKALRQQEANDLTRFSELQYGTPDQMVQQAGPTMEGGNIAPQMVKGQAPNPMEAYRVAAESQSPLLRQQLAEMLKGQKFAEGEIMQRLNPTTGKMETIGRGGEKLHSVDGNLVNSQGQVIFKAPKVFAPHAPQLVPVQGGFAEYNPNTKTLTPIGGNQGGAPGTPTGALLPPLPQHLQTEASSINQQKSTINDVLKAVEGSRQYFGTKYAVPSLIGGELGAAKMNQKLPSEAVEARSQVFNTASSVIKERAGTAQSKQEKETIMRFLPSEFDNDKVVIDKLNGFNKYLESKEKGLTPVIGAIPVYRPNATQTPSNTNKSTIPAGVTPEQWNVMTSDEKAAFK